MKFCVSMFSLLCFLSGLFAIPLITGWNSPSISSQTNMSQLVTLYPESLYVASLEDGPQNYCFSLQNYPTLKKSFANFISRKDDHKFLEYAFPNGFLQIQLLTGQNNIFIKDHSYYFVYTGTTFRANLKDKFLLYFQGWKGHFSKDTDQAIKTSDLIDSWYQKLPDESTVYFDNMTAKMLYKSDLADISLGRGKFEIGNNISGSVILSNKANEYGYFQNEIKLGKLTLSYLLADLVPDSTRSGLYDISNKYLSVHQFSWNPSPTSRIFLGEQIIYGNRSIDLKYLLTVSLYRVMEHKLGDRDNELLFGGFQLGKADKNLFYTNIILDEFSQGKIFSSWWGNKYAIQTGNCTQINKHLRLGVEFVAIRPWTYTHKDFVNKFSHDNVGLGYPLGSNLIVGALELNYVINNSLRFDSNLCWGKQGSVGNTFETNYQLRPSDNASWLEGENKNVSLFKGVATWQFLAHHNLKAGYMNKMTPFKSDIYHHEFQIGYQAEY